ARQAARHRFVAKPQARIGDRDHGGCHFSPIHVLERFRNRPSRIRGLQKRLSLNGFDPDRRTEMMMDVDTVRLGGCSLSETYQAGDHSAQEASSIQIAHEFLQVISHELNEFNELNSLNSFNSWLIPRFNPATP